MQREIIHNPLGGAIKSARQKKGMTQAALAEKLSITPRHLKAIENSGQKPSYDLLVKIIHELGIPADIVLQPDFEQE